MEKDYPENLKSLCNKFKSLTKTFIKLNLEILGEVDNFKNDKDKNMHKVIKNGVQLYKRQFAKDSTVYKGEDETDVYKRLYDDHIRLYDNIYQEYGDDIASDMISDGWLLDNKLKIWLLDDINNKMRHIKTKIGYMICISAIYSYSFDIVDMVKNEADELGESDSEYEDEREDYPDKYLYYLYSIFSLIATERDKTDIDETIEELGRKTGLYTKKQNRGIPNLSSLGDFFSADNMGSIGDIASSVMEKLEPTFAKDDPNYKNLTEEQKQKRRDAIKKKAHQIVNPDMMGDMFQKLSRTVQIGQDGKPTINPDNITDGIASIININPKTADTINDDHEIKVPELIPIDYHDEANYDDQEGEFDS